MRRPPFVGLVFLLGASAFGHAACSVYDASLLEPAPDGAGGEGARPTPSGAGGSGGVGPCQGPADCGVDSACRQYTCEAGRCSVVDAPKGTVLAEQTPSDCKLAQCDGEGAVELIAAPDDLEDDGLECTTDSCQDGLPVHTPKPVGAACSQNGGEHCNAGSACVECVQDADCASMVCSARFTCAKSSCGDGLVNGDETDEDCGGSCSPCATGKKCVAGPDCIGGLCDPGGVCQPTCTDTVQNQDETAVDCGGSCAPCGLGEACAGPGDCVTNNCKAGACACGGTNLVISEIRSRGAAGGEDEFVELYNPTDAAVVLDATWKLEARAAEMSANWNTKWIGAGLSIPPKGHFLIKGANYSQAPQGDASLTSGIKDASALRLVKAGTTVDAVCYYFNLTTLGHLQSDPTFGCEGTPVSNAPHNDSASGPSNADVSLERKPGGSKGSCLDTGDNAADFASITPALPENVASPAVP